MSPVTRSGASAEAVAPLNTSSPSTTAATAATLRISTPGSRTELPSRRNVAHGDRGSGPGDGPTDAPKAASGALNAPKAAFATSGVDHVGATRRELALVDPATS